VLPEYFGQLRLLRDGGEQYMLAFGHENNIVAAVGMDGR
jgi:hypothetical protein